MPCQTSCVIVSGCCVLAAHRLHLLQHWPTEESGAWPKTASPYPSPGSTRSRSTGASLGDVEFWAPYISCVLKRNALTARAVRPGVIGTYPTFIVNETHVVKMFGPLFDGRRSFAVEDALYDALRPSPLFPVPERISSGWLYEDSVAVEWRWPYIISRVLPGSPMEALGDSLSANGPHGDRASSAAHSTTNSCHAAWRPRHPRADLGCLFRLSVEPGRIRV